MSEGEVSGQNGGAFGEAAAQASTAPTGASSEMQAAIRHENTINQGGVTDNIDSTKFGGGKYDSVEALDSGYLELQSKFSQKMQSFTGAPEEGYEYAMPDSLVSAGLQHDTSDPIVAEFAALAKEGGMNQEMYDQCMDLFYDAQARGSESNAEQAQLASEDHYNEQIKELGGNENEVLARVEDVITTITRFPGVTNDEVVSLVEGLNSASQLAALEKIVASSKVSAIPTSAGGMPLTDGGMKQLMTQMMTARGSEKQALQEELDSRMSARYPGMAPMSGG